VRIAKWDDKIKTHAEFWSENVKEEEYLEDLSVDGRITFKLFKSKCSGL
jgi:hypothetical protein